MNMNLTIYTESNYKFFKRVSMGLKEKSSKQDLFTGFFISQIYYIVIVPNSSVIFTVY